MFLIIGCGFLGQYVLKELLSKTEEPVICTYHRAMPRLTFETGERVRFQKCDVTCPSDLTELRLLCGNAPLKVFYLAAYHNIDAVYRNPEAAHKVNVEGLSAFLEAFDEIESLFFASSDCVYGESQAGQPAFRETDACLPINAYGRQKLQAESFVLAKGFYVLRFSLLYGPSLCERKTFYDLTLQALQKGESVEMIDGLARNAIPYQKAAEYCVKLALWKVPLPAVINVSGDCLMTKFELGAFIAKENGIDMNIIQRITMEEGKKFFLDKRASVIALDNFILNSIL